MTTALKAEIVTSIQRYTNMSKAVRWQMPFASLSGQKYRVDIYDEQDGSWSGITQLLAGDSPFTTDEDSSDDFFCPLRSQSGTMQICTVLADGTPITLDDIMPPDNVSRPVKLWSVGPQGDDQEVEWQGFLSCEAYSQSYTAIPEHLDIPLISVLEAMDSVEVALSDTMAFNKVIAHALYALKAVENKCGMQLWGDIYLSNYFRNNIMSTYFYNNVYFDAEELVNGDNIVVEVHSISCKAILEQIAKFFGGVWREVGRDIYLEAQGTSSQLSYISFITLYQAIFMQGVIFTWNETAQVTDNMADQSWMGTDHQRSILQGARRLKVTAKLKDFDCSMSLQECPVGSLVENPEARQSVNGEVHVNTNETFYSLAEHRHMLAKAVFPTDLSGAHLDFVQDLTGINYANTIFWTDNLFRTEYYRLVIAQSGAQSQGINQYLTSFMCWWRDKEDELKSGLMLCGNPKRLYVAMTPLQMRPWTKFALTANNYIFKQKTPLIFAASDGFLRINMETLAWSDTKGEMPAWVYGAYGGVQPTLTIALSIGNMYAYYDQDTDSYLWDNQFHTIAFPFERKNTDELLKTDGNWNEDMGVDEQDGIYIKIPSLMVGIVSIRFYHELDAIGAYAVGVDDYAAPMFNVFIPTMDVDYVPLPKELRTDRSENVYADETGKAFRDEIESGLDIATDAYNTKLATMLWSDSETPIRLLTINGNSIRPEVDLLNRMKSYYDAARQRLELKVKHPTAAALPMLKLNGINDGKTYLPLSESRDWRTEECTLTCFEAPE